jgi:hypothetical protein
MGLSLEQLEDLERLLWDVQDRANSMAYGAFGGDHGKPMRDVVAMVTEAFRQTIREAANQARWRQEEEERQAELARTEIDREGWT